MTDKFLRVTFSDSRRFDIPAHIIADNRATYYANHDEGERKKVEDITPAWRRTYDDERKITLEDDYEIHDWAFNNMNWEDVRTYAIEVPRESQPIPNYDREWINVKHEVITK